ncbi:hypothetical protein J5N97_001058 [Dioscorea zingiberensis]|uniref:Uncharacterized protein n=1 Tax=Dioscorea zingiberensis TaxID=325984 RepID=A0A9D5BUV0_9LILI|nr:hypothetical protein J5N97_001058 [Dioscorea zingiberensis]
MGEIPLSLSNCSNLLSIRLGQQYAPQEYYLAELGVLSKLQVLSLSENTLSGGIPSDLRNTSSLTGLCIYMVMVLEGRIPDALGKLTSLRDISGGRQQPISDSVEIGLSCSKEISKREKWTWEMSPRSCTCNL